MSDTGHIDGYVFGPIRSRRLGRSLGVSPIPYKTCNYSCIYCQLGRTRTVRSHREDFIDPAKILGALDVALRQHGDAIDCVTFAGQGEPTLCRSLGLLVREAKAQTRAQVVVITNGSLLHRDDVREDLSSADLVIAGVDAADVETFRRVNRPHSRHRVGDVVEGLATFRRGFAGRIWVEVMLMAGVNDSDASLGALAAAIRRIGPDCVYINRPVRPPADLSVAAPTEERMARARAVLGGTAPLAVDGRGADSVPALTCADDLAAVVASHPITKEEAVTLGDAGGRWTEALIRAGRIHHVAHGGRVYLTLQEAVYDREVGR